MLWILIVGLVAGFLARLISPGPNEPRGFILTMVLGVVGAFLATFIGQAVGWYSANQGAGFITATIGALVVLFIWNRLVARGYQRWTKKIGRVRCRISTRCATALALALPRR